MVPFHTARRAASQNVETPLGRPIYSHKNDLMTSPEMLQNWTKYLSAHSLRFSLLISHTWICALEAASVDSVKNVWTLHTGTQTLFCCLCHSYRDRKLLLDFKQTFPRCLYTTFSTLSPCWPSSLFFLLTSLFLYCSCFLSFSISIEEVSQHKGKPLWQERQGWGVVLLSPLFPISFGCVK